MSIRRALAAAQFTDIVAIFDLLDIQLVHGWLVDPQVRRTTNILPALLLDVSQLHLLLSWHQQQSAAGLSTTIQQQTMCQHRQAVWGAQDGEAVSAIGGRSYNALTEHLLSLAGSATPAAASERAPEAAAAAEPTAAAGRSAAAAPQEAGSHGAATMRGEGEEAATGSSCTAAAKEADSQPAASPQGEGAQAVLSAATGTSSAAPAKEADSHGTAHTQREGEGAVSPAASLTVAADAGTGGPQAHAEPDEAAELLAALHLSMALEEAGFCTASQATLPKERATGSFAGGGGL